MEMNTELIAWIASGIFAIISGLTTKWALSLRSKGNKLLTLLLESADVVAKAKIVLEKYTKAKEDKKFTKAEVEDILVTFEELMVEFEQAVEAGKNLIKKDANS